MRRVNPRHYTEKYYLSGCTGYQEFRKYWGKVLETRLERLAGIILSVEDKKVLDIGCGRGEMVFWASRNGASQAVGIDYSKSAVSLARKALKKQPKEVRGKVQFKQMDAKNIKFKDNSFDAVFLIEVLEHLYPEEQELVMKEVDRVLKDDGFVFVHTAPGRLFNDYTYKFWCYPISTVLVAVSNLLTQNDYGNLARPENIREPMDDILHVNEPDYFSLKKLFVKNGFCGKIRSTNITIAKPVHSWKDKLFNSLVYLMPLSYWPPFNIVWGNDFYSILRK
jgi:ubiquinone/menaquinone biosynthesis C-methylase UbiE